MSNLQQIFNQKSFTHSDLSFLEKSIERFPYFQPLRVQYLKAVKQLKPNEYENTWNKHTVFLTNSLYIKDEIQFNNTFLENQQNRINEYQVENKLQEENKSHKTITSQSTVENPERKVEIPKIKTKEEINDSYYLSLKKLGMEHLFFQEEAQKSLQEEPFVVEKSSENEILSTEAQRSAEVDINEEQVEQIVDDNSTPANESIVTAFEEIEIAREVFENANKEVENQHKKDIEIATNNTLFEPNPYYENLIHLGLFKMVPYEYIVAKNAHKYDDPTTETVVESENTTEFSQTNIEKIETSENSSSEPISEEETEKVETSIQELKEPTLSEDDLQETEETLLQREALFDDKKIVEIQQETIQESQLHNPLSEGKINTKEEIILKQTKPTVIEHDNEITLKAVPPDVKLSFQQWLKFSNISPYLSQKTQQPSKEKKIEIIEDFIEKNPKIRPQKNLQTEVNQEITPIIPFKEEISHLMTETLAELYVEQHKYNLAIKAYKILSLKYPEKNRYFASRIEEIKKL